MTPELERLHEILIAARSEIRKVIIGQTRVTDHALITVLCRQHALIEGVPGIAKTLLARTIAAVLGSEFGRIQFTPDLMPADITGTNVFDLRQSQFTLQRGPIFTAFLLADEINRAPAKTQSALLQAMQERAVTIDRETHPLPPDFTVFATQNPVEHEGTYALPEAQKDRFMIKIAMDPPEAEDELELARRMISGDTPEASLERGDVRAVLGPGELTEARRGLNGVSMRDEIVRYIVDIVRRTRAEESILTGAGPRATQALIACSRARAALDQRDFVTPDDVKSMTAAVLEHRVILRPEFEIEGVTAREAVSRILESVTAPS